MPKSKAKTVKAKPAKVNPRIRGKCVQDRITGNWTRIPDKKP